MGRYSLDLRRKIVEAYEKGDTSIRKVAKQFSISPDTVRPLLNLYSLYLKRLVRHIADAMKQLLGGNCPPYGLLCSVSEVKAVCGAQLR